ncbi:hypothetical protein ACLQ3K_02260 [Tsukamurella sp. DT100]|uniref:hypothetical protein n=1 Tax=Tsukamurella sp. DT100 TaxID=3393415 RepID=UPI003CF1DEB7
MPDNEIVTGDASKEQSVDQFKRLSYGNVRVEELRTLSRQASAEASTVAEPFRATVGAFGKALSAQADLANEALNQATRATSGMYEATKEQEENALDTKAQLDQQDLGPQDLTPPPAASPSGPSPSGPGLITV